ncbi:hypothetical protein AHAS_Ahas13G0148300 [Arachis hypogaea]
MMKKCELCKVRARTFCESDQASLCWTCDANVHGANFLVAKHSRTLLCRDCYSLTPWKATGAALLNAVSLCHSCSKGEQEKPKEEESEGENNDETEIEDDDDDDGFEDVDGENQVVPWCSSTTPPPPPSSSAGSEESGFGAGDGFDLATSLKRRRDVDASDRDLQHSFEIWANNDDFFLSSFFSCVSFLLLVRKPRTLRFVSGGGWQRTTTEVVGVTVEIEAAFDVGTLILTTSLA